MKLRGIKISREAKILFGLMCLAAAILIWVNLFTNQRQGFGGLFGGNPEATLPPSPVTSTATPDATTTLDGTALDGTATSDATDLDGAATQDATAGAVDANGTAVATPSADALSTDTASTDTASTDAASTEVATPSTDVAAVSPDGAVATTTPDAVVPTVDVATTEVAPTVVAAAPTAARDVQLAELPFLVTEAPVAPTAETTEETASTETTRPGEQRASINPFSPIVLAPVEAPAQIAEVAPPVEDVQVVPVPDAPVAIGTVDENLADSVQPIETGPIVAEGPLPEAVIPAPAVASLPRPLPGGTLPVAPDILRNMSRTPSSVALNGSPDLLSDPVAVEPEPQLAEVPAAIREPGQTFTPVTAAPLSTSTASTEIPELELEPVGSLASSATSTSTSAASGAPLVAGASPLSSYLRNNDVRFTGSAIGPVSVGIFSSKLSANPVVIPLGQTLPDTEFVLTNLQGKEAEFTYAQEKQLLTLDLRR